MKGAKKAAAYPDADERKIRLLKEAGFNCIRSSHQPVGKTMLEVCDRLGMYVMDEFSDVWTRMMNTQNPAPIPEIFTAAAKAEKFTDFVATWSEVAAVYQQQKEQYADK